MHPEQADSHQNKQQDSCLKFIKAFNHEKYSETLIQNQFLQTSQPKKREAIRRHVIRAKSENIYRRGFLQADIISQMRRIRSFQP